MRKAASFYFLTVRAMENLPTYVSLVFILTTLLTIFLFYLATQNSTVSLGILFAWLAFQGVLAATGFYTVTDTIPPRFLLLVGPPLLLIIALFMFSKGRQFLDSLNIKTLTFTAHDSDSS